MKKLTLILLIISLAGCAGSAKTDGPPNTYTGPKVLLCEHSILDTTESAEAVEEPATESIATIAVPIALAVAPKAIDIGIQMCADYLKERAGEYSSSNSARASRLFFETTAQDPIPRHHYLAFVYGTFGQNVIQSDGKWTDDRLQALKLVKQPKIYAEFEIKYAHSGTAYTAFKLVPHYLDYREVLAKRSRKPKTKNLLFSFDFTGLASLKDDPNKGTVKTRFARESIELKSVRKGSCLKSESLDHLTTGYWPLPKLKQIDTDESKAETELGLFPFSVLVTFQETEKPDDLLLKSAQIIEKSKDELSKALLAELKEALEKYTKESKK